MARKKSQKFKKTPGGVRNKFEKSILDSLKKRAKSVTYEEEKFPYVLYKNYLTDFKVTTKTGKVFYIETKGHFTYQDMIKMRAVKESNPDIDIRFVFYSNKPVRKGSKFTYTDWCDKYGFKWAVGEVPAQWLKE